MDIVTMMRSLSNSEEHCENANTKKRSAVAERMRLYRQRIKERKLLAQPPIPVPSNDEEKVLPSTRRSREWRKRKKQQKLELMLAQGKESDHVEKVLTSAKRTREWRKRKLNKLKEAENEILNTVPVESRNTEIMHSLPTNMTKTKQATLFSLKSWKNVAADNIQKYKDILANHDQTESEILKALVSLKNKNPSRDIILSARIDMSLEFLERHQNPRICHEARMLRNHWQLNKNCTSEIIVIDNEEPPIKKCRMLPETEICEIKIERKQTIECKAQAISHPQKHLPNEAFLMNTKEFVPLTAIKPTNLVSESPSMNRATYNNVMSQLCDAIKLFTQELGEQEVRLYLEKISHAKH